MFSAVCICIQGFGLVRVQFVTIKKIFDGPEKKSKLWDLPALNKRFIKLQVYFGVWYNLHSVAHMMAKKATVHPVYSLTTKIYSRVMLN
jgi:hypothetical protein